MLPVIALILLAVTFQTESTTTEDLKTIFQIPNRKNYDELEILERSSFGAEATPTTSDPPKSYANAQVFVRFGGESKETPNCGCGQVCQCKQQPQLVPVLAPLPYCVCFPQLLAPPQTPPPIPKAPEIVKEDEKVEEPQNSVPIKNNNHPEILETVNLSNDAIAENVVKKKNAFGKVAEKIEPNELSPNVKIINLELPTAKKSSKDDLVDCLVPYEHPKLAQPKLLVTFPIFGDKEAKPVEKPKFDVSLGYNLAGGSGYFDNPARSIIYRKPTVLSAMDRKLIGGGNTDLYVLVPIEPALPTLPTAPALPTFPIGPALQTLPIASTLPTVPVEVPENYENEDCCCYSCAKYAGELNEQSL